MPANAGTPSQVSVYEPCMHPPNKASDLDTYKSVYQALRTKDDKLISLLHCKYIHTGRHLEDNYIVNLERDAFDIGDIEMM